MYICIHMHTRVHIRYHTDVCVHICVSMSMQHVCTEMFTDAHVQTYSTCICLHACLCAHTHSSTKGEASRWGFL